MEEFASNPRNFRKHFSTWVECFVEKMMDQNTFSFHSLILSHTKDIIFTFIYCTVGNFGGLVGQRLETRDCWPEPLFSLET